MSMGSIGVQLFFIQICAAIDVQEVQILFREVHGVFHIAAAVFGNDFIPVRFPHSGKGIGLAAVHGTNGFTGSIEFSKQRVGVDFIYLNTVRNAVIIAVRIHRICTGRHFVGVRQSIAVGIDIDRTASIKRNFIDVTDAVSIGILILSQHAFHPVGDTIAVCIDAIDPVQRQ